MKYRIIKVYRNCMPGKTGFTGKQVDAVLEVSANFGLKEGQVIDVEENDMKQGLSWGKLSERNLSRKAQGRGMGPGGLSLGPGGSCVCPNCGFELPHERAEGCVEKICPECGALMERVANSKNQVEKARKEMKNNHWGMIAKKAQSLDEAQIGDRVHGISGPGQFPTEEGAGRSGNIVSKEESKFGPYFVVQLDDGSTDTIHGFTTTGIGWYLEKKANRTAQATEDEQAFAEEIAKQISEFAGDEKDVGQIIEMIKGKTFNKEEKDTGKTPLETEIIKAARSGMQPKDIASVMEIPMEIVAELVASQIRV